MTSNYKISNSPDKQAKLELGNVYGGDFQSLFNRLMLELDPKFYPIRQNYDHGNDGFSPQYEAQFACYAPESSSTRKSSFNQDVLRKAQKDLDSFIKHALEDTDRLEGVKNWIFVFNHETAPDDLKTFIEKKAPDSLTKEIPKYPINIRLWGRREIVDKCTSLSEDQYQRVFQLSDSEIQKDYSDRVANAGNKLELIECQENIQHHKSKGDEQLIEIINAKLEEKSLPLIARIFYRRNQVLCFANLEKFDEAQKTLEDIRKVYGYDQYPAEFYYSDQCNIYYARGDKQELIAYLSDILKNLPIVHIKTWGFFVGFCFDETELNQFRLEDGFQEDISFKRGGIIKLSLIEEFDLALQLLTQLFSLNLDEEEKIINYGIYTNILFNKYQKNIPNFPLTVEELSSVNVICDFADKIGNHSLKNTCLCLLQKYSEISLSTSYTENHMPSYILTIVANYQKKYHLILSQLELYVSQKRWKEVANILYISLPQFQTCPQDIKDEWNAIFGHIVKIFDNESHDCQIVAIISLAYEFTEEHQKHYELLLKYKDTQDPAAFIINLNLLEVSVKLGTPLHERQTLCEKIFSLCSDKENIEFPVKILMQLFFQNQKPELIKKLYQLKIQDNLQDYVNNLGDIFLYLLNTRDKQIIEEFLEDYLESGTQSVDIYFIRWVSMYITCFSYRLISQFRCHLGNYIDTINDADTLEWRNIYSSLCLYEYSEDSLKIDRDFHESIAQAPVLVSEQQLQVYCAKFYFYGLYDEMYAWLYFHWRRNPNWTLWKKAPTYWFFPNNVAENTLTSKFFVYKLKRKYLSEVISVVINDGKDPLPPIDNFYDITPESQNAVTLKNARLKDELILDGEIKGTWTVEDMIPYVKFLIELFSQSPNLVKGSIEGIDPTTPEAILEFIGGMQQQLQRQVQQAKKQENKIETTSAELPKEYKILDSLNCILQKSFLIDIRNNSNKELPELPISTPKKYNLFCKIMKNKQIAICDSLTLWWLFCIKKEGIDLTPLFDKIMISSLTWKDIVIDTITPEMGKPMLIKQGFIEWVKKTAEIRDDVPLEEGIFTLYQIATNKQSFLPVDVGAFSLLITYSQALLLLSQNTDKISVNNTSVLYLLEFCISEGIIDINQLITCINIVRNDFLNESERELYKIPLRYIYNEYLENPAVLDRINWECFVSKNMDPILNDIERELGISLKSLIIKKL